VEIIDCDRLKADFRYEISGLSIKVKGETNSAHAAGGFTFGDGSAERGFSASHTYSKPGIYALCFIVKDSIYGCVTEVCKRILIDPCDLRAKFDYRQSGKDFAFFAKSNDSNARYVWDFGDGTSGTGSEVKHSYQSGGTYIVCLKVLSKSGTLICDYKVCERVEVKRDGCDIEAKFEFRQDDADFAFFAKVSLAPARFVWDFGDGNHGYGDQVKHSYSQPGVYEVCLTVYYAATNSSAICSTNVCQRVEVKRPQKDCDLRAEFDIRVDGRKVYVNAKANQEDVHFFWSFGDMHDATGSSARHKYREYGTYEICLIVFNPKTKCKVCICKKVVIHKPCDLKAEFVWKADRDLVYFKARSNGSNSTRYFWNFGDGQTGSGQKIRHRYSSRGVYTVTLLIYDVRTGCKTRVSQKVYVGLRPDQKREEPGTVDSVSRQEDNAGNTPESWKASVNPSPARSQVSFSSDDKELHKVNIYSADGSLALEVLSDLNAVDISKLPKGFYYAHVYATDGSLTIVKFLKE
jgi:PKD repeat protein